MAVVLGLITTTLAAATIRSAEVMKDIVGMLVGETSICSSVVLGPILGHLRRL